MYNVCIKNSHTKEVIYQFQLLNVYQCEVCVYIYNTYIQYIGHKDIYQGYRPLFRKTPAL